MRVKASPENEAFVFYESGHQLGTSKSN